VSLLRRSIGFSMLDKYLAQALAIGTTVIMARLLTPAETGLFIVAQAVILLAENFRDFGIGTYLVQAPVLDRARIRTAFTISMALSLVMGAVLVVTSGWLAAFYADSPARSQELQHLLLIACIGFAAVPFGSPVLALLRREMAFRSLAVINVAVAVTNAIVTISLGLLGFGAAAYMWAYVGSNLFLVALVLLIRPDPTLYRPSIFAFSEIFRFGLTSAAIVLANMAYDLIPRLWFGRALGLDAVGIYARATALCQIPDRMIAQGLQPVLLPAFARRRREGGDLGQAWLDGARLITVFHWPALLMLALLADPIVALLLGAQWGEAAPLLRFMALATMALAPACLTYPLLVAAGQIRASLVGTVISLAPSAAILILAAPHGLQAVANCLLVVMPLQMGVALVLIMRVTGLHVREILAAIRPSLIVTLATSALPALIMLAGPRSFAFDSGQAVLAIIGAAVGWAIGVVVTGHPIGDEIRRVLGRLRPLGPDM
jgi:O-antigen/teichoic acid export membrane protein